MGIKKIQRPNPKHCPQNPVPVYEVMTDLNKRSINGRVVINPPTSMAPLQVHKTGEAWYICYFCGRSTLDQNKHLNHIKVHSNDEELVLLSRAPIRMSGIESGTVSTENTISRFDSTDKEIEDSDDEPLINFLIKKHGEFGRLETCKICRMTFLNAKSHRAHLEAVHFDEHSVFCNECNGLYHKEYISSHRKRVHDPANTFKCPYCTGRLSTAKGLKKHITVIHPTLKALAGIENKINANKNSVIPNTSIKVDSVLAASPSKLSPILETKKRNGSKTNKVLFRCKKCLKTFTGLRSLRYHFLIHTGEKPHKCPHCPLKFRLISILGSHKKRAHGNGTFLCLYCPCKYMNSNGVTRHMKRVHTAKGKD